ncbi:acyl-CoA dehydrogenase family protein [Actinoplanes sp. NPDC049265]|uniref:acyl-CoA dehydrogenase family protein n=1 Tax=Actinoplanes sp. NPDC049265 TaxID=3363902 RepID=UPI0037198F41
MTLLGTTLLDRIRTFSPEIREAGPRIDADGAVPAEIIDRLRELGVFRLAVPAGLGGTEAEPRQQVEIFEELGRADGSVGWCAMIGAVTGIALAWIPSGTAAAMLGDPRFLIAGVAAPMGRATPDGDGFRLTGRWSFASAGRHASWLVAGALTPAGVRMFILGADQVTIHDTWHTAGLKGTGSHDFTVDDVLVPAERVFDLGRPPVAPGPLYGYASTVLLSLGLAAVALGIARAAIEDFTELAQAKRNPASGTAIAAKSSVRAAVAEATALHRSSLTYLLDELATPGTDDLRRAGQRLAIVTAGRNAARAVDLLYHAAGGSAVYLTSPLQRHFRDVHTATQHAMLSGDVVETAGAVLLGQDVDTRRL